jgi:hypothetical protein
MKKNIAPEGVACPVCIDCDMFIPVLAIQRLFVNNVFNIRDWRHEHKSIYICTDCADAITLMEYEGYEWPEARKVVAYARINEMIQPGCEFTSRKPDHVLSRGARPREIEYHHLWIREIGYEPSQPQKSS